ncbi:MAG: TIGR01459 family HAD-type hydrolase [Albidovulum sp.]|uniref:TIGR01459 family HAD-type hydrolase n=1 Tax=Albidovulum sp. TaxID=1872424 RepID=UPI003CB29EE7
MTRRINGVSEVIGRVDAVCVDQYGVLHDGKTALPGARDCLERIRAAGLPVLALTNSGKRADENAARLERLGFPRHLFTGLLSSGEVVWHMLRSRLECGDLAPGARVCLLSRDNDRSLVSGLDLTLVAPGSDADLVLIAGIEPERHSRDAYRALLSTHAKRGVPAIAANPDHVMYTSSGAAFGPGAVADDYRSAGGHVHVIGKPSPDFFAAALDRFDGISPGRVLMVGDSPVHDIAGAKQAGLKTLLIEGGVQSGLGTTGTADYVLEALRW